MKLDDKKIEYFTALEETFNTRGWALIVQGLEGERQKLPEAGFFNAKTIEELQALRVRYGVLTELVLLPGTIDQQKQQIREMDPEDAEASSDE